MDNTARISNVAHDTTDDCQLIWQLAEESYLVCDSDGTALVRASFPIARVASDAPLATLIRRLADGIIDAPPLRAALDALMGLGLVSVAIVRGEEVLARLTPAAPGQPAIASVPAQVGTLDPTLTLRPVAGALRASLAGGAARLDIASPLLIAALGEMTTLGLNLAGRPPEVGMFAQLLATLGAFESSTTDPAWHPVDLEFHNRTRRADLTHPYGPDPAPADDPAPSRPRLGPAIPLPGMDLAVLLREDRPFAAVMEGRSANQPTADAALTFESFGALLFRAVRARAGGDGRGLRPYPSGGRCYELDLYVVVGAVGGLTEGLYRYDPAAHALQTVLADGARATAALAGHAAMTMVQRQTPPALLILAADFGRVYRRYRGMPYALILKHVGIVMQTLALAGEAQGLVVRPLGGGHAHLFAGATGLDPRVVGSVGELAVFAKAA